MKELAARAWMLWILIVLVTACQGASPAVAPDADLFGAVRTRIEALVAEEEVPSLAVAVARGGEILWEEGFGLADVENGVPATAHTAYPLASVSKPLTATGLMVLVAQGRIDLDRPIDAYLGAAKLQARVGDAAQATVRRAAAHTAGLPLHAQPFFAGEGAHPPSPDETVRRYGQLVTAPGERFQYSNLGYGLLGQAIVRVSGQSYASFMQEAVFGPLGMDHTAVHSGPELVAHQAVKYTQEGQAIPPCDTDSPGASGIYGSAHDLLRFGMFHLHNELPDQRAVLRAAAIDRMQRPSPETGPTKSWERAGSGYGIGWFVGVAEDGLRIVYHGGSTFGVSTVLALVPEEDIAVVVLSNTQSPWPEALLVEILGTLLPGRGPEVVAPAGAVEDGAAWSPDPALVGVWEGWVNTYEQALPLVLEIEAAGKVYVTLGEGPRTQLQDVSYGPDAPHLLNAGGGPFLRGWMQGNLGTADVRRGHSDKLWLEVQRRDRARQGALNGVLIAFSQRERPTGPLSHWVVLEKR